MFREILSTHYPEDQEKIDPCIENQCTHPHIEIRIISEEGHPMQFLSSIRGHLARGVYAKAPIEPGETIGEYVGELRYVDTCEEVTEYTWQIGIGEKVLVMDASQIANELAFVNSYKNLKERPNVVMKPIIHRGVLHFGYVATEKIAPDEEILVDYRPKI